MLVRQATVVDNLDEKELGRIQVRILPELEGVEDDLLPWARPDKVSHNGTADGVGTVAIPEIDSIVRVVIFDEEFQDIRYVAKGEFVAALYPRVKFDEEFDIADVEAQEYPQPNFTRMPDGSIYFHNTETAEAGVQFPSGLYVVHDSTGGLHVRYATKVKIYNADDDVSLEISKDDDKITLKAPSVIIDTDAVEIAGAGDSAVLFAPLEEVLKEILGASVIAPTGPSSPLVGPDLAPLKPKLSSKLSEMKSTIVVTD